MRSCIYIGSVKHRRYIPRKHNFIYKNFMLYLNLDELPTLFDPYRFWSANKFNLAHFKRSAHLGDPNSSLKDSILSLLKKNDIVYEKPCIDLLTNFAYFGYWFNPISLYFCYDNDQLKHIIAEVTNTPWREQHIYILNPHENKAQCWRIEFEKKMHVSPFMTMDHQYRMLTQRTDNTLLVNLRNYQNSQRYFSATLALQKLELNTKNLAQCLTRFPFYSLQVVSAIYWQALKLWLKGIPFVPHPRVDV